MTTPARDLLRPVLAPVALGAALAALGGWLWWEWWAPPPTGKVYETSVGPTWYPDPFDPGITRDFNATATFVVVGFGLALVLGLASGWLARNRAVPGLAAVGVASLVGAAVMTLVGLAQSPPDPQDRAGEVAIGTVLPGNLEIGGWTPYLAWPVGALLGYLVVMLALKPTSLSGGSPRPAPLSSAPGPQG